MWWVHDIDRGGEGERDLWVWVHDIDRGGEGERDLWVWWVQRR